MRGIFLKGLFFNGCARKRERAFLLPQAKRQKLLGSIFAHGEDNSSEEDNSLNEGSAGVSEGEVAEFPVKPHDVDVPSAPQGREKFSLYPSVVYEGDMATVKLGVGQMVMLDGCAMVQVVEGQAAMLGYSFARGTDVLVCSSSKLAEVITIEARCALEGGTDVKDAIMTEASEGSRSLGCQLRFASHGLGQQILARSGRSLSFRLEFVDSSLGKKWGRQFLEQQNQDQGSPDSNEDDQLNLDLEDGDGRDDRLQVDVELAATKDGAKKRKGWGQTTDSVKRQRMLDSYSSATTVSHAWKEGVETITLGSGVPVVAVAVQRMLESLRLLGSS